MQYLIVSGRAFHALALLVWGGQQFYFGSFRPVFFSAYRDRLPLHHIFAYLFGLYLLLTGILLFSRRYAQRAALVLGAVWLTLFIGTHLAYELFSEPNKLYHLGLWTTPLKTLALSGCAFVVAHSYGDPVPRRYHRLNTMAPYGNLFFLFTMTAFGIGHLVYGELLAGIVPGWMANPVFWVYVAGIALAGSGIFLMLGIRIRVIAWLLSLMIFLWFWMVHLPGAISSPVADRGNLVASAFDALAFSGTALLIGACMKEQQWIRQTEAL